MNPLSLLDSILADWASPRVRRLIHGLVLLAVVLLGIWLAAEGDWKKALAALAAAVYAGANHANTDPGEVGSIHDVDVDFGDEAEQ